MRPHEEDHVNKSVLGRDPFAPPQATAPAPAAAGAEEAPRTRPPRPRARKKAAPVEASPAAPPAAPIDRVELVEPSPELLPDSLLTENPQVRPSFCGQKLAQVLMRFRSDEVDPFGFDPVYWKKVEPIFEFLFERYWRVELEGLEHIPATGRMLLVANHSGTLPYDGAMLKVAIERKHPSGRALRFLVEDFVFHFPFLGAFMNRIGGVRACQDNAQRLLGDEQLVVVFPEGIKGIGKLYKDRYHLQRFGRGGFIKLAMATRTPIVPVAIVGAEEIHPMLAKLKWLARPLGLPYLPVTPTFPWLGPLGALPLPSKWTIRFGAPIQLEGPAGAGEDDMLLVMQKSEDVRTTIQQMIDEMLAKRGKKVF
jgi:1-acyl-sn-glycerol-3-phosphate acyltransferase